MLSDSLFFRFSLQTRSYQKSNYKFFERRDVRWDMNNRPYITH